MLLKGSHENSNRNLRGDNDSGRGVRLRRDLARAAGVAEGTQEMASDRMTDDMPKMGKCPECGERLTALADEIPCCSCGWYEWCEEDRRELDEGEAEAERAKGGGMKKKQSDDDKAPSAEYQAAEDAITDVIHERRRQDVKWGVQNHTSEWWLAILMEEVGELAQAISETHFDNGTSLGGTENIRKEAVQCAAVALALIECMNRSKMKEAEEDEKDWRRALVDEGEAEAERAKEEQ